LEIPETRLKGDVTRKCKVQRRLYWGRRVYAEFEPIVQKQVNYSEGAWPAA